MFAPRKCLASTFTLHAFSGCLSARLPLRGSRSLGMTERETIFMAGPPRVVLTKPFLVDEQILSAVPAGTYLFVPCSRHLLRGVPGYSQSHLRCSAPWLLSLIEYRAQRFSQGLNVSRRNDGEAGKFFQSALRRGDDGDARGECAEKRTRIIFNERRLNHDGCSLQPAIAGCLCGQPLPESRCFNGLPEGEDAKRQISYSL